MLFVIGVALNWPQLWLGLLLALPLLITAAGLGWRSAVPLVPIGLALAWLRTRGVTGHGPAELAGFGGLLVLGTLAGNNLFSLWHATARSARRNERRARLLSEAALAMESARDAEALFAMLPRLLAEILAVTHAEVFVPDGDGLRFQAAWRADLTRDFRVPRTSVMGRALWSSSAQYVPDTAEEASYVGDDAAPPTRSELALPLLVGGQVRAVLNLEHAEIDAFDQDDHRTLDAFAHIAQEVLGRLEALGELERQRSEQMLIAGLTRRLLLAEGAREAAATTLADLVPALDVEAGAVAVPREGRLHSLALYGPLPDALRRALTDGMPLSGLLRHAWERREPLLVGDAAADTRSGELARATGLRGTAIVPIANASGDAQALLLLADLGGARAWSAREERVLGLVATSLGVVLDRATLDRQLVAMLDGVRGLARAEEPSELYRRAAGSAVRLIPGAEGATILVRGEDGFRYAAAVGYDVDALRTLAPFSDADELSWYRDGVEGYRRGTPRIVRGPAVRQLSAASGGDRSTSRVAAARVDDIVANICVPITDAGEVVAVLNVDSFTDPDAFGSSARRLAEAFAQQVGAIQR
ncbi:MAG: GAF domain-containing protein, partial [Deinococcales bacterium]